MKSHVMVCLAAVSFMVESPAVCAQPSLWEIYTTSNRPYVNVVVERYESDSLHIRFMNEEVALHQDSVIYLLRRKESRFGVGFVMGAVAGGLYAGCIARGQSYLFFETDRSTTIAKGVIVGGMVGGLMGLGSGTHDKYRLEKMEPEAKRRLLRRLFKAR